MHPGSAGRQCGANPGMPPLRGCLHVGLYRIGPHPTIFVITTIVKTYIESPEPASNLADEQFLQRHSWIGRIPGPDGRQLGHGSRESACRHSYRAVALPAEAKAAGAPTVFLTGRVDALALAGDLYRRGLCGPPSGP